MPLTNNLRAGRTSDSAAVVCCRSLRLKQVNAEIKQNTGWREEFGALLTYLVNGTLALVSDISGALAIVGDVSGALVIIDDVSGTIEEV